jgi:hypothetical protein
MKRSLQAHRRKMVGELKLVNRQIVVIEKRLVQIEARMAVLAREKAKAAA